MSPMRVKSRKLPGADQPPRSPSPFAMGQDRWYGGGLPEIRDDDPFRHLINKLSVYFAQVVQLPVTFEQLRTTSAGDGLRTLVEHLSRNCSNPAIVNALLALRWHYGAAHDDKGVNDARANAAEIVAWRFLTHLTEREVVDYCLYEIPDPKDSASDTTGAYDEENGHQEPDEATALLPPSYGSVGSTRISLSNSGGSKRYQLLRSLSKLTMQRDEDDDDGEDEEEDPATPFIALNALEIAAVADAKRFLSQHVVQKIITGIWNGDIIFWDKLAVGAVKKPRFYNKATADPFSRLRVPKYLKSFEVVFFAAFLFLYYAVLVERNPDKVSGAEVLLYVWFAAFFYDELSEWIDAGSIFYATDVWNMFDMTMLVIGFVFAVMRILGLSKHDEWLIETSFDVLSLEALFMIPRVCSILSLSPYWGTLIPCLKEMGKDFIKFMVLVLIIYLGFLTTFSLVGRDHFTLPHMAMNLTKIFFGSSYVGFDIMEDIDPLFGPPLMLIFVTLSSILLMGSLTGMLSNSFSRVISHAREEYLYVYSIYVLEASTSNRLTHYYPPFNLIAFAIFRPLRLFLPSDNKFRAARIALLKATHLPIVGVIMLYELIRNKVSNDEYAGFKGPRPNQNGTQTTPKLGAPTKATSRSVSSYRPTSGYRPSSGGPQSSSDAAQRRVSPRVNQHPAAMSANALGVNQDDMDQPTDTDVRISELSSKIDRLTAIILAMQDQQNSINEELPRT